MVESLDMKKLAEIKKYNLKTATSPLTKEQELALGFLIKYGIRESPNEKNYERSKDIRRLAIDKLVEHNIRLIFFAMNKNKGYFDAGVEPEDLFSAGMYGLFNAAEKFDYTKGYRFSTFAYKGICYAFQGELRRAGRKKNSRQREDIENLGASHLIEEEKNEVEEQEWHNYSRAIFKKKIGELPAQERKVLNMRFFEDLALSKIGNKMGVSRARISQIQIDALKKLRKKINKEEESSLLALVS